MLHAAVRFHCFLVMCYLDDSKSKSFHGHSKLFLDILCNVFLGNENIIKLKLWHSRTNNIEDVCTDLISLAGKLVETVFNLVSENL